MRVCVGFVFVNLAVVVPAMAQSPAFVPQLSHGGKVTVSQPDLAPKAFVVQLPADAKPRTVSASPAVRAAPREHRLFISAINSGAEDHRLIVSEEEAVTSYDSGWRPSIPPLSTGATVSLTANEDEIPRVGAGAVML